MYIRWIKLTSNIRDRITLLLLFLSFNRKYTAAAANAFDKTKRTRAIQALFNEGWGLNLAHSAILIYDVYKTSLLNIDIRTT